MRIHRLKTLPVYFEAVKSGDKMFEIRYNDDRGFQKGDLVDLVEIHPSNGLETSNEIRMKITYVTNFQQKDGYVVFGMSWSI